MISELGATRPQPLQVTAHIKISIPVQRGAKEHSYHVSMTDHGFAAEPVVGFPTSKGNITFGSPDHGSVGRSIANDSVSLTTTPATSSVIPPGQARRESRSLVRSEPLIIVDDSTSEIAEPEERSAKKARWIAPKEVDGLPSIEPKSAEETNILLGGILRTLKQNLLTARVEDLFDYIKDWRGQWTEQGGWQFENITRRSEVPNTEAFDKAFGTLETILGSSLNASRLATHAEIDHVQKGIMWVVECRKVGVSHELDHNEKWRNETAQFHDSARKERVAAEKTILERSEQQQGVIEKQADLLAKLARANG